MQLIQLIEPNSVDIKNNMSTLGEAIENNHMNGAIADKENNVCDKISPNKHDTVSNAGEYIKDDNSIEEQLENKVKGLNGIVKTNNDVQTLSVDSHKIEKEINAVIDNGSAANSQRNGNSSLSELCKSSNGNSVDTAADENINLENKAIDLNEDVISSEKQSVSEDPEDINVSPNEKHGPDVISIANKLEVADAEAVVNSDKVTEAEKSSMEIFIENEVMVSNISGFSPNSDTNEEVNISAQLQQLENDPSIENDSKNPLTEDANTATNQSKSVENKNLGNVEFIGEASSNIDTDVKILEKSEDNTLKNENEFKIEETISNKEKPASPVQIEKNHLTKKTDISETSELSTKKQLVEVQGVDENIALEMDHKTAPTDDKPDYSSDISIEETPLTKKDAEDKSSMEIVNDDGDDITTNIIEVPDVSTSKQLAISNTDNDMEVDDSKPVDGQKLESKSEDANVEKELSVKKYITVKKFTDMVYPTALPTTTTENIEVTDISDGQLTQVDQDRENEVMEVDASDKVLLITPVNNISLNTLDQIRPDTSTEVIIENEKAIEDKLMEKAALVSEEKKVMTIEQQEIDDAVMEIDSAVPEIQDCEEVPIVEKCVSDIVDKDKSENTAVDVNISEKPSAVINIIDNDDEDIKITTQECSSIKKCDAFDVISIDDNVKDAVSESQKFSSDVEILNEAGLKVIEEKNTPNEDKLPEPILEKPVLKQLLVVCKLSNTMDILSDDEDDIPVAKPSKENKTLSETPNKVQEQNKCINIDDDDDIMFIEDTNSQDTTSEGKNKSEQQGDNAKSQTIKTTGIQIAPDTTENKISSSVMHEDVETKICDKGNIFFVIILVANTPFLIKTIK